VRRLSKAGCAAVALLLAAATSLAAGQSVPAPGDTVRLNLAGAVSRGVELNELVRSARASQASAEGQVVQARAGALPQVNGMLSYNRALASLFQGLDFGFPPGDGEEPGENPFAALPFGQANTWMANLTISQPVYAAGRISTALDIARQVRLATALEVDEAETNVAMQVRQAYFQAVLAQEFVAIAREAYSLASAQLAQVELFRQQGTASEFDVLRARVERDNLEPQIVESQNARRLAELNLKRLIHVPADQPVELVTPLAPELAEVDRDALRAALLRRPALRALEAVAQARAGAVRIARADRLPTVGANATFSYQAFPNQLHPFATDWRRDWNVGLQVTVPVFDGFRTSGRVQQARAELTQAELQRELAQRGLEMELEVALGEFDGARAQIQARRATVAQARRALELAELRFRSGLATQLDISSARLMLEQARVNEAQSLFNYMNALARLERVSGGEIPLVAQRLPSEG
jgi:outer membrane protein